MLATSYLHSYFLHAGSAVMLSPVHPSKLQTRGDFCCACQSVWPFIPSDSGMTSLSTQRLHMAVCQSGLPSPDPTFCRRFIESVRMMACVVCVSLWEASHCIACVTASISFVRLEIVTLWAPLSSCTVLPPYLPVNSQPDQSIVTKLSM